EFVEIESSIEDDNESSNEDNNESSNEDDNELFETHSKKI
ncbi:40743_t:CDS:2, partial [Gigaspora margarita]